MTIKAFCAGAGLLGLLTSHAFASMSGDGAEDAKRVDTEALELFVSCESSYPLVSVKWVDGEREKSAEKVSHFLDVPSVTAQVILDKAGECFSALKGEQGMTAVNFNHVELRCGVGPDITWGRIVVRHTSW
jgi:hypothetical protein